MPVTKMQTYSELVGNKAEQVTQSRSNWTNFLDTAARLYKYPFAEQLMIYAQRPDATACAPLELWNKPMNRFVRRGSKGIALIDDSADIPHLKYVFDVSDTEPGRENPKSPYLWEMRTEHMSIIVEKLVQIYDLNDITGGFSDMLHSVAEKLALEYYNDNARNIGYGVESSFLEEYDDFNLGVAFREAATVSISYALMSRCGIDTDEFFDDEDFQPIFDFNTQSAVYTLGTAVSEISENILREIEITIKNYERNINYERDNVQFTRGLSDSQHSFTMVPGETNDRQIWADEEKLSETAQDNSVQHFTVAGGTLPAFDGNRQNSERTSESDNVGIIGENPASEQSGQSNGMDGSHEQPEIPSGGNNPERTDLQLNQETENTPSEPELSVSDSVILPENSVITPNEFDAILRDGGSRTNSVLRIAAYFMKDKKSAENADFLMREYIVPYRDIAPNGKGFQFGEKQVSVWFDGAGMTFGNGMTALQTSENRTISWEQAAERIRELFYTGKYISKDELDEAANFEVHNIAEKLWYLHQDISDDFVFFIDDEVFTGGFPQAAARIGELLLNPEQLKKIDDNMQNFCVYYEIDPSILRFHNHNPRELSRRIEDFRTIEPKIFPSGELPPIDFKRFITDDEIDEYFRQGNKSKIFSYFLHNHTSRERANFIKNEYGHSGGTWISDGWYSAEPVRGISLTRGDISNPYAEVNFNWNNAAQRINSLINSGRYLTQTELDSIPENERIMYAQTTEQLSLLSQETPILPSVEEQINIVAEEKIAETTEETVQNDIDLYLLNILDYDKSLISNQFKDNPRSREAAHLIKEIYGDIEFPISQIMKRIAELIADGKFAVSITDTEIDIEQPEILENTDIISDEPPITTEKPSQIQTANNFKITDEHLGEGGVKIKYAWNIAAIKTLQTIESENRSATSDEQEILSRYVGWGGIPQVFDENNDSWAKEYSELHGLLSESEYTSARASTLNAHYTSPTVIRAIYDTIERMGFAKGNILEPSMGVGNFLGLLPESMAKSRLYGVELDSITGRIAQKLYPKADIKVTGFESTNFSDNLFDVSLGNIPFGNYKINDRRYDKYNFHIHDYFFAKTLDQTRPGGIIAFITSKGILDKKNPEVRRYIAQRAELLGAVRLPNNAFLKNAGTQVTSDIIFLQKRDKIIDIVPDWVHLGLTKDNIPVNRYFIENPHMILGTMVYDDMMYGNEKDTTCKPFPDADLAEQLEEPMSKIQGKITEIELDDIADIVSDNSIPAEPNVKNFSYALVGETVYFRENSSMYLVNLPETTLDRVRGMIALRNCTHELIDLQLYEHSEAEIKEKQAELNWLYDKFTLKYGVINSAANSHAFADDSSYYLLCSLEILDENGNLERKADMFTKRTIKQHNVVTSVDTASEALAVSIGEKAGVDMEYMSGLTGRDEQALVEELRGVVFLDFNWHGDGSYTYRTADDFLSGNVREKLSKYREALRVYPENGKYYEAIKTNIAALEAAQPKDLEAGEISVRLGSTWVDKNYIAQFVNELLQTPFNLKKLVEVNYFAHNGSGFSEWNISGKSQVPYNNVLAYVTYGTSRINAYAIIEETLNLKDVRIYDYIIDKDKKEKRVLNKDETMLAQQKQEAIKQAFKDWIWKVPQRRHDLVKLYNERFNNIRPREYDGSHINFHGISPEIELKPHQINAIAHVLYGGNTLLAHEVGAGKTFEMVASAMESKRLGLCQKSMFAVPNHLTEQTASEFLRLYPAANILVATKKDFEMKNRMKFCAKISTGDYDAVIVGHSQMEKIPMSCERQERLLKEQLDEIIDGIEELKRSHAEKYTIKQLEKTRKSVQVRLEKLRAQNRKDDVVNFEQLGINRLFIDESQNFKDL